MDCLRILTTGNEANKVALFTIPAAVPALVKLMAPTQPDAVRACLTPPQSPAAQEPPNK